MMGNLVRKLREIEFDSLTTCSSCVHFGTCVHHNIVDPKDSLDHVCDRWADNWYIESKKDEK